MVHGQVNNYPSETPNAESIHLSVSYIPNIDIHFKASMPYSSEKKWPTHWSPFAQHVDFPGDVSVAKLPEELCGVLDVNQTV